MPIEMNPQEKIYSILLKEMSKEEAKQLISDYRKEIITSYIVTNSISEAFDSGRLDGAMKKNFNINRRGVNNAKK